MEQIAVCRWNSRRLNPRRRHLWSAVAALLCAACGGAPDAPTPVSTPSTPSPSTIIVLGVVRERLHGDPGEPIAGVYVSVVSQSGPGPSAYSGPDGRYEIFGVPARPFQIKASRGGYESTTHEIGVPSGNITVDLVMTPIPGTFKAFVTDAATSTAVAGATIEVLTGPNKGRKGTTDTTGSLSLSGVWGDFDVSISRDGYQAQTDRVMFATILALRVTLLPLRRESTVGFAGRLCADWDFWFPGRPRPVRDCVAYPTQARHEVTIPRAGRLDVYFQWRYQEDYSSEYFWLEVRCGSVRAEQLYELPSGGSHAPSKVGVGPGPLEISVPEPAVCEIKPSRFNSFKSGIPWTDYRIDVQYP